MERLLRVLSFACALPLFIACGDPPTGGDEDASMPDGATDMDVAMLPDADAAMTDPDGSVPEAGPADPMIRFVEPAANVRASSAPVPLRVVVDTVVERVDIVLDGTVIANLSAPYEFSLATASLALGEHVLIPRALVAGATFEGPAITVTIERTAPEFVDIVPSLVAGLLPARTPVHVTFDEVIDAASVGSLTVAVQYDGSAVAGAITVDGMKVVFTPTLPWIENGGVSVAVSGMVTDLHGNTTTLDEYDVLDVRSYWDSSVTIGADASASFPGTGDYLVGIERFSQNEVPGTIVVEGRIDGIVVAAPTLDGALTSVRFVDGGVDAAGVAYIAYEAFSPVDQARTLVVARRDPVTTMWSKQTIVATGDPGTLGDITFHVSAGGHAWLRFQSSESFEYTTFHRGPSDPVFTPTSAYNAFAITERTAFPGSSGRSCAVQQSYSLGEVTINVVCENGGGAQHTILVAGPMPTADLTVVMRANASGDAILAVDRSVYLFDGDAETISPAATLPGTFPMSAAVAIGPLGHACAAQMTYAGPAHAMTGYAVLERVPGQPFGVVEIVRRDVQPFPPIVDDAAVDAAGHCFIGVEGGVIHDATFDGEWSATFALPGLIAAPGLFAGQENQVFLTPRATSESAYVFAPLTP